MKVEVPEEGSGSGIYSDLAAASEALEGFYSAEAHSTRGPSSVVRGRSRTRTPRPSTRIQEEQAPQEEGPEDVEVEAPTEKPEPPGSRYIVPKSARRKVKKAQAEPEAVPETPGSPKAASKAEQPETIETPRGPALAPRPKSRPKVASRPTETEELSPKLEKTSQKLEKTSPKPVSPLKGAPKGTLQGALKKKRGRRLHNHLPVASDDSSAQELCEISTSGAEVPEKNPETPISLN